MFTHPVKFPRVAHRIVAVTDWHEDALPGTPRVIVSGKPVKSTVHAHIPWVPHATGEKLQVVAAGTAAENATLHFLLVQRVVAFRVGVSGVDLCQRIFRHVIRRDPLQVTNRLGSIWLYPGIAHREIEPAIRAPVQPVNAMAEVVEAGINNLIFVCDIVSIGITQYGQFRGISNP